MLDRCNIDIASCILEKTIDMFQYTWVTMIGEMYELIAKYLKNSSDRNRWLYRKCSANEVPPNAICILHL